MSESASEVGFCESAVSPSACGYRPVSVRTLEDPLEVGRAPALIGMDVAHLELDRLDGDLGVGPVGRDPRPARPSNASSPNSTHPVSAHTTCATPTPPSCCNKESTPKSSANASATPASHLPWTSTNTSYPACKPRPPPPSEPPSSATGSRCTRLPTVEDATRRVQAESPLSAPSIGCRAPTHDVDSMILKPLSPRGQLKGYSQAVSERRVKMVRTERVAPTARSRTIGARMTLF